MLEIILLLYLILPPWSTLKQKLGRSLHGFLSMKRLEIFLLPPGWDGILTQSYPSINSPVHTYTTGWREALWESCPRTQFIIWLAPEAGKINPILCCDWLPELARWSYLDRSGLPAISRKRNFLESLITNPLLTKLVRSRWLDIALVPSRSMNTKKRISSHLELTLGQ